ncbi:hypothetical protein [Amycolatopsis eburnea]|uniref:Uncharacterized protein n=1 Tax=Amycolatopsis eburnea TaxID=2267691 RepID=A0A3R9FCM1_9PSEU|nr:hypothetical protein [Amycolatopsis eburnea]RSD21987.1 hypothetical protein EIY87_09220 [Amycolatopsis eburnea]
MTTTSVPATGPRDRSRPALARSTAAAVCVVRGCTRPVYTGKACPDCVTELGAQLRELGEYPLVLRHMKEPVRGAAGRGSPGYGSRPPLRLDVLAALDPRTLPTPEDDVWSIWGTLDRIAAWIAAERGEQPRGLWYVLTQLQWAAGQEEFGDVADAIQELHRRAQGLAHDRPEATLGDCTRCGGQVLPEGAGGRCEVCARPYVGLGLVKLRRAQDAAA